MKNIILFFLLAVTATGCRQTNEDIVSVRKWKYGEGFHVADMMIFKEDKNAGFYISHDTIYKDGKPEALVASTAYNVDHYVLTIHSLDHKQTGVYMDKGRAE